MRIETNAANRKDVVKAVSATEDLLRKGAVDKVLLAVDEVNKVLKPLCRHVSPFRVINVIPKGKTKPEGLKNGGKKDED